jgi:SAM-dependent methyltransferase
MSETPNSAASNASFEFDALNEAVNYRHALVAHFRPHLGREVIEVGAGIGQITELIAQRPGVNRVHAVEPDPAFCQMFRQRLPQIALTEGTLEQCPLTESDSIISVNVLEHILEDQAELARYARLLKARRGTLCLFVPARMEIYAPIDRDFGHHRRYTHGELETKLRTAGFSDIRLRYFNFIGYFSWWLMFRVFGKRKFDVGSVRLFDRWIFPAGHWVESNLMAAPIGQSLMAFAKP